MNMIDERPTRNELEVVKEISRYCKVCGEEKSSLTTDGLCLSCAMEESGYQGFTVNVDRYREFTEWNCDLPPDCSQEKIKSCYENPEERCELWKTVYGETYK